ncbi:MAG: hypothetical protein E7269_04800 [Lachnospiraceae bacterium]|nr:hypothetical protein [Lachnospiraceae bacterium]
MHRLSIWMQMAAVTWTMGLICKVQVWASSRTRKHPALMGVHSNPFMHRAHDAFLPLQGCYIVEVVVIKAIPKKLLIHDAKLHSVLSTDTWGKDTLDQEKQLEHIRIEPSGKIIRDKNNAEIQLVATLFHDCRNSRPQNVTYRIDDIIVFNGQKHRVQLVEPLFDGKQLHHYEIGLVRYGSESNI